jgi:hypothetical protein
LKAESCFKKYDMAFYVYLVQLELHSCIQLDCHSDHPIFFSQYEVSFFWMFIGFLAAAGRTTLWVQERNTDVFKGCFPTCPLLHHGYAAHLCASFVVSEQGT